MSFPIVLHHFEGAVVRYFMAYCGNVAIMLELWENYGATANVNVLFQPHSSSYLSPVSVRGFALLTMVSILDVGQFL